MSGWRDKERHWIIVTHRKEPPDTGDQVLNERFLHRLICVNRHKQQQTFNVMPISDVLFSKFEARHMETYGMSQCNSQLTFDKHIKLTNHLRPWPDRS